MRKKICPPTTRGFSLIEIIIVVFLTGIMVFVIANVPQAIRLISGSQDETKVREVAAKKIEDLRLAGFTNLANGTTSINDSRLNSLDNVLASTVIADCPVEICTAGEEAKKVTITISWEENNQPKTFQINTLIGKGGIR